MTNRTSIVLIPVFLALAGCSDSSSQPTPSNNAYLQKFELGLTRFSTSVSFLVKDFESNDYQHIFESAAKRIADRRLEVPPSPNEQKYVECEFLLSDLVRNCEFICASCKLMRDFESLQDRAGFDTTRAEALSACSVAKARLAKLNAMVTPSK